MVRPALVQGLNPAQREAVLHQDGPLLILAGAGSGKTRVITSRIAALIDRGVDPEQIVAITFTNKAAGEMGERVEALLPKGSAQPRVQTFHAFAVRLLRRFADRIGFPRGFSILDRDDLLALVREAALAAGVDVKRTSAPDLAHGIGRAKERLDDAAYIAEADSDLKLAIAKTLPKYRMLQRIRGGMDFEDLVAGAVQLLEEHPDVRAQVLGEIRYVLVDEYQDTNHAQYRLARLLAGESCNLAVCGDPDQSIYGWRGADMGNILRFEADFPGAKVVLLEENYRSTATILTAANALIAHNKERKEKQLRATAGEGNPVYVRRCLDAELEARYVGERIEKLLEQGVPPGEVAVIVRTGILARAYEEALLKRNLPVTTSGGTAFTDRREVRDALCLVRLALNHADDLAAMRALKLTRGVGKRALERLTEHQRTAQGSLVDACREAERVAGLTPAQRSELKSFSGWVDGLAHSATGVEQLVAAAVEKNPVAPPTEPGAPDRQGSLNLLLDAARDQDRRKAKKPFRDRAREFLDRLALLSSSEKDEHKAERVLVTTVHAAKGLEFSHVFCVAMEEGTFPHERAVFEGTDEEERRLAYVAFTRARRQLTITYANSRAARLRSQQTRRPSRFLYELPAALLWDPVRSEPHELPPPPEEEPAPAAPAQTPTAQRPARHGTKPLLGLGLTPRKARPKSSLWSRPLAGK
ncbi:MAG: UvrD-helicase domain-containing protein [Planctomycetes bacterium]|nr:UvrD-helicase domain-containing protein [Planctomycetota bacterium]